MWSVPTGSVGSVPLEVARATTSGLLVDTDCQVVGKGSHWVQQEVLSPSHRPIPTRAQSIPPLATDVEAHVTLTATVRGE
jgi:hypothetical protein